MPDEDTIAYLKDFGAATASNGAVGLYHIDKITPEAKELSLGLIKDNAKEYIIDDEELERVYKSYPIMWKKTNAKPHKCFIGCPHLTLKQLQDWTDKIVNGLKEKNSSNIENMSIVEKYEVELKDLVSTEDAISKLYVQPAQRTAIAKTNTSSTGTSKYTASGSVNTAGTTSSAKANLGIALIRPVSGTITSRFGVGSRIRRSSHTGLDIATSTGTPIAAAASGTVTFSGYKGSYGNMLVISHGNGVQTYYGHCSKLYVSAGTQVSQGQIIGAVGSTGNSTGPHLHLEVRVNGVAYNPQNYVY